MIIGFVNLSSLLPYSPSVLVRPMARLSQGVAYLHIFLLAAQENRAGNSAGRIRRLHLLRLQHSSSATDLVDPDSGEFLAVPGFSLAVLSSPEFDDRKLGALGCLNNFSSNLGTSNRRSAELKSIVVGYSKHRFKFDLLPRFNIPIVDFELLSLYDLELLATVFDDRVHVLSTAEKC